jgi:hypothetical protein
MSRSDSTRPRDGCYGLAMRVVKNLLQPLSVICLLAAPACGDDDDAEPMDHENHPPVDGSFPETPCPEETPEFRIDLEASGEEGAIDARLVDADYLPPRKGHNDWEVEFVDSDGAALDDVELVKALPFMPVHGHDGNHEPKVEALDEPGRFAVDELNLWMTGPWQVQLTVSSESAGDDYIVFDVCVD